MARFDIGPATSRPTGFEAAMRNRDIRKELEPQMGATRREQPAPRPMEVERDYTAAPAPIRQEAMTSQIDELPLPMQTVKWESRFDKAGNPIVYKLPAGDMGGNFEISGINDRYHPEAFKAISSLPPEQRAEAAAEYVRAYTAPLVSQLPKPMQAFTQDLAFNRGLGGATRYIQEGLKSLGQNVSVDGRFGPQTLQAIQNVQPRALMQAASLAQSNDEARRAEEDPRRLKFKAGLDARIRNRLAIFGQG